MVAKCGLKKMWHWAHLPSRTCDPWWENETPWHRKWKSFFPEAWREYIHVDPVTNEKHIADVKTAAGRVIEFQNSPMPPDELASREKFYGDMIWVVNGERFQNNFHVLNALPDPDADFVQDIVFFPQRLDRPTFCFWRKSEQPDFAPGDMVRVHSLAEECGEETRRQIQENYKGHHMFDWVRPRSVWYESAKPVFFDLGFGNVLLRLMVYKTYVGRILWCIQYVSTKDLIESNGGVYEPHECAT
jgi:hypothetical protein